MQRAAFPLASASFLLSGFAALTYQIVWQRLLVLPMGADVYSTTIIVAAFMAGLGLGSLAGGHVADRLSPRRCLLVFIAAELAVAVFGLASRGSSTTGCTCGSDAWASSRRPGRSRLCHAALADVLDGRVAAGPRPRGRPRSAPRPGASACSTA